MVESHAVVRGEAMFLDALAVFLGGIALVAFPVVEGIGDVEIFHDVVPVGFCEDGSGCNVEEAAVTLHHASMGDVMGGKAVAIHEEEFRGGVEASHRFVHGLERGPEDIDLVDPFVGADTDRPGNGFGLYDFPQFQPLFVVEQFAVRQFGMGKAFGQDDGSGHHGSCETAPARLVQACFQQVEVVLQGQWHWLRLRLLFLLLCHGTNNRIPQQKDKAGMSTEDVVGFSTFGT